VLKLTLVDTLKEERFPIGIIALSVVLVVVSASVPNLRALAIAPTVLCGVPILIEVIKDAKRREVSAEALVLMALVGCILMDEYIAAAEIAIIMSIGELLETIVTSQARSGMDALGRLKVGSAHLMTENGTADKPVQDIRAGDRIRLMPGEIIPLDGIIIQGFSSVDKSAITGESVPVDVGPGEKVLSGTTNLFGSLDVEIVCTAKESTIAKMERLMESADAGKSRIVDAADRWAKWIILGAMAITVSCYAFTQDLHRSLTVMVVFCPCAFVLATPTGIMAAAGNMARNGILLRDASAIEGLARVRTMLFDKTGTLTTGEISSLGFTDISSGMPKDDVESKVAALESRSEHPLGKAIASSHEPAGEVQGFVNIPGHGVSGTVDGIRICAGNRRLMEHNCPKGLETAMELSKDAPFTTVFVGIEDETVGYFGLEDRVKDDAADAVRQLKEDGIATVMITGDSRNVGESVAGKLGIDDVVWECLPETKLELVERFEEAGPSCMIGDGMNDAPSLRRATVGISMGGAGNDLAVVSSDIMFLHDDISKLPGLVRLCKRSILTIYAGLALAMTINIAGAILAVAGEIGPIAGAIIHNGGSFIVILLAATLLTADAWSAGESAKMDKRIACYRGP